MPPAMNTRPGATGLGGAGLAVLVYSITRLFKIDTPQPATPPPPPPNTPDLALVDVCWAPNSTFSESAPESCLVNPSFYRASHTGAPEDIGLLLLVTCYLSLLSLASVMILKKVAPECFLHYQRLAKEIYNHSDAPFTVAMDSLLIWHDYNSLLAACIFFVCKLVEYTTSLESRLDQVTESANHSWATRQFLLTGYRRELRAATRQIESIQEQGAREAKEIVETIKEACAHQLAKLERQRRDEVACLEHKHKNTLAEMTDRHERALLVLELKREKANVKHSEAVNEMLNKHLVELTRARMAHPATDPPASSPPLPSPHQGPTPLPQPDTPETGPWYRPHDARTGARHPCKNVSQASCMGHAASYDEDGKWISRADGMKRWPGKGKAQFDKHKAQAISNMECSECYRDRRIRAGLSQERDWMYETTESEKKGAA